jgi:SAM-dependent methyltransferase
MAFGSKIGRYSPIEFFFRRCARCDFVAVQNPITDFTRIYDEAYYQGKGADPLVDYEFELEHPHETVRQYEWHGIQEVVRALLGSVDAPDWLDYGGGAGGLVRYLRASNIRCVGYDSGGMVSRARQFGIPFLTDSELRSSVGKFDVVTMIEVVEHLPQPIAVLKDVKRYLKPGGLLFLTTGNAEPHLGRFSDWPYVTPEIHVSFFTPRNLAIALEKAGFSTTFPGAVKGWSDIIRFKILKNLRIRQAGGLERIAPWWLLARLADRKFRVSSHPVGWAA